MRLEAGSSLGIYQISGVLGAGGMGEVYRARDPRLEREVAIKILPDAFSGDEARLARFEREARSLAALNHPNVATVYGFDQDGETHFLAMELVEGEHLGGRLRQGPLSVSEAIPLFIQIAAGLEAAHERGIAHRDLKPANIMVTSDRRVKILDFGLATAMATPDADLTQSPTMTVGATRSGTLLGTAGYMSPEQARGEAVDRRADVWAFGCLLWEALSGKPLFEGKTLTDTLAAVIHHEPEWSSLPADLPKVVHWLLRRCLERDVGERMRDMGDIRLALQDAQGAAEWFEDEHSTIPPSKALSRSLLFWVAMGTVLLAAVGLGWWLGRSRVSTPDQQVTRFVVRPPADVLAVESPALSPDGRLLAYVGSALSHRLYLHELDSFATRVVPDSEGARNPFFSADSRWLFFFSRGRLRKISVLGGSSVELCDVATVTPGGVWGPGNTILYSPGWLTGIYQVSADGGEPRPLTKLVAEEGEVGHWWPELVPGDRWVLFTIWLAGSGLNDARIGLLDLESGKHRALFPGSFPKYATSGHVVYYHAGSYYAVRFDRDLGRAFGEPALILEDVAILDPVGTVFKGFSLSATGTLAFLPRPVGLAALSWMDRDGQEEPWPMRPQPLRSLDLSPDGRRLLTANLVAGTYQFSLLDAVRGIETKLSIAPTVRSPNWHPDGESIAFTALRRGSFDVYTKSLDLGGVEVAILDDERDTTVLAWTASGDALVVLVYDYEAGKNFLTLSRLESPEKLEILVEGGGDLQTAAVSPDGRWLAYDAAEEGGWQSYVQPLGRPGRRVKVSPAGGTEPLWSTQANELFYWRGNEAMAVRYRITDAEDFEVLDEHPMFALPERSTSLDSGWDVAPDGRFVVSKATDGDQAPQVRIVIGWTAELAQGLQAQ